MLKFLRGSRDKNGLIKLLVIYSLLICISFIYLYPILHMLTRSFMTLGDMLDSSIHWIPSRLDGSNYASAVTLMDYWTSLWKSFVLAGLPTLCTLVSCSLTGYGLARYKFRGRAVIIGIIILAFVLPRQVTMIPTYQLYKEMGLTNTIWSLILPAFLSQGLNSSIFIMIFWQFFRMVPQSLIEASKIDGAGAARSFFTIALPSAVPAFITVGLFCFVWYWNESYLTGLYLRMKDINNQVPYWTTLTIQLQNFTTNTSSGSYTETAAVGARTQTETIKMAATILTVLPMMIVYFVLQRHFVESIDRTGITGE
ncbi:MAG: carbohydrate ABC transporter permease [Clostridia bacterium]|nr:carbohydrate ABC transporter permease [Clostridia bacterium]MBR4458923.1 carbohydrate ABC transporter permease [Clostridia bacterium]